MLISTGYEHHGGSLPHTFEDVGTAVFNNED